VRMEANVGGEEVVSMRDVFLYVCWRVSWTLKLM